MSVGTTTGFYVSAYAGKGSAKGNSELHTESVVTAKDTLTLASGNDTTIKGAQAIGDTVLAKVGGDLLIQSEQDTDDYKSKQQQAGVKLVYGFSGSSASYSQQKVNSNYTSVKEQSGIQAGNGGFDIEVGGNTHLIGGAIASTADATLNRLSTNSLTVEDLKNQADYKSSGVAVGAGTDSTALSAGARTALSLLGNSGDSSSSTTKSDIAAGTVEVRNGDTAALSGLGRKATELQQSGLKKIFDEKKLAEQKELAAVASEVGFRVAGDVASVMQRKAQQDLLDAPDEESRKAAEARLESWSDGGASKILLHGLTGAAVAALGGEGALQGAAAAAGAEAAKSAMSDYLVAHGVTDKETYNALMELGSAAIGGVLGGQNGANTALSGDRFNRQLHPDEVTWIRQNAALFAFEEGISEEEAKRRLTVEAAARVDAKINGLIGNTNVDESAQKFLSTNTNQYAWGRAFQATDAEYNDFHLYGKELASSPDNFLTVYNSLYQAGVRKDTLQLDYNAELLTFAGTQIGSSGRGVLAVPATGLVLGGGAAVAVVATPVLITACLSNPIACHGLGVGAVEIAAGDAMGGHGLGGAAGAAEKKAAQVVESVAEKVAIKSAKSAEELTETTVLKEVQAGAGGNWNVLDEVASPEVVQQASSTACGAACGEMLLKDRGVFASQVDLGTELTSMNSLASKLNKVDSGWVGNAVDPSSFDALNRTGTWSAMIWDSGNKVGHWVVVNGVDDAGRVIIKDPFNATKYKMEIDEFKEVWNGHSAYKQ